MTVSKRTSREKVAASLRSALEEVDSAEPDAGDAHRHWMAESFGRLQAVIWIAISDLEGKDYLDRHRICEAFFEASRRKDAARTAAFEAKYGR